MKILVLGHKEHGKSTFCGYLAKYGKLDYMESSKLAAKNIVFPILQYTYGYDNWVECYDDRRNHRKEWADLISEYNTPLKHNFAMECLEVSDIYDGMRCAEEVDVCKEVGLYDVVIGLIDPRKPLESKDSCTVDVIRQSDLVVYNDGELNELEQKAITITKLMK